MQITPVSNTPQEVLQVKQRLGIVGNAPALIVAISRAIKVAPIDLSVLITGESGTGKEFFPKIIHQFSPRKHAKYIAVNCGAIPEGTIDSELFGHEKGAFTGAVSSRKGYFEEADGGTIFLDEVAELPLTTQARLLRVLETGEFLKVGSSTVQKTNIRVVAATNVDMLRAVEEGRFREDLYYRLSTVHISIPPLRDRGADISLLARKFASDFSERYHMPLITFSEEARSVLNHYNWPGNVRQLKNLVEQMALFDAGGEISRETVESYLPQGAAVYTPTVSAQHSHSYEREREMLFNMIFRLQREIESIKNSVSQKVDEPHESMVVDIHPYEAVANTDDAPMPRSLVKLDHTSKIPNIDIDDRLEQPVATLEDTERETIKSSLERNNGRRKATARELNISERTLYRKIKEYGLE